VDTRDIIGVLLERAGASATTTDSSTEALEALERMLPHLLIIDIGLPEEDGYTLIRKARAFLNERGHFIPAVALTAYSRLEDQKRALAAGFDVHMSKPPRPTELIDVVARLTGRMAAQEKSNLISRTAKTANEQ